MNTNSGIDPAALFDMISKLGFPLIFIIGQLREWWYVRPHVDLMATRVKEMSGDLEVAEANARRAAELATQSNSIAEQALHVAEGSATTLAAIEQHLHQIRDELAKLSNDRL